MKILALEQNKFLHGNSVKRNVAYSNEKENKPVIFSFLSTVTLKERVFCDEIA